MLAIQQPLYSKTLVKELGLKHQKIGNFMSVQHVARNVKHYFRPSQPETPSSQDALEFSAVL